MFFIGPAGAGKTHAIELLAKAGMLKQLSIGHEIKKQMIGDPDFNRRWGGQIATGRSLPDSVVCGLFDKVVAGIDDELTAIDGFPTSSGQVSHARKKGVLGGSLCLIFNAPPTVCRRRHDLRSKQQHSFDATTEVFESRSNFHRQAITGIVSSLLHGQAVIQQINVECEISEGPIEDVIAHIKAWQAGSAVLNGRKRSLAPASVI